MIIRWVYQRLSLFKMRMNESTHAEPLSIQEKADIETSTEYQDKKSSFSNNQNTMITPAFELSKEKQNKAFQAFIKSILDISASADKISKSKSYFGLNRGNNNKKKKAK